MRTNKMPRGRPRKIKVSGVRGQDPSLESIPEVEEKKELDRPKKKSTIEKIAKIINILLPICVSSVGIIAGSPIDYSDRINYLTPMQLEMLEKLLEE